MRDKLAIRRHYLYIWVDATMHVAIVQATMHETTYACMIITQFHKRELEKCNRFSVMLGVTIKE